MREFKNKIYMYRQVYVMYVFKGVQYLYVGTLVQYN